MSLEKFIQSRTNLTGNNTPSDYIDIDIEVLRQEYENGVSVGEYCGIQEMAENFSWKRGFQNCFTGYPNDGKTKKFIFLALVMAITTGWKWVIWSPEMKSSNFINGKVVVNYNDLVWDMIWSLGGVTPYQHTSDRYRCQRQTLEKCIFYAEWISKYFIFIEPKDKSADGVYSELTKAYDKFGFDGVLIDPFKNIHHDINLRDDIYLDRLFDKFKDLAIRTNTVMNWIAHPKSNVNRVVRTRDGAEELKPCDQYMLNGGSAWDNGMDGIYSIFRPNLLLSIKDLNVHFLNLKQRKQELVAQRGVVTGIKFNAPTNRYLFNEVDVLSKISLGNVLL